MGLRHGVQDEAGRPGERRHDHERHGEHRRGQLRHVAGVEVLGHHGQPEAEPHHGERQAEPAEEGHGAVVAEQARDGRQHEHAVGEGGQLALRALGPVAVVDGHVGHPPAAVHRPDGDLGLYLEAAAHDGHGLHEGAGEGAVARHDVLEGVAVDHLDEPAHQVVAEVVEGPLVLLAVGAVGDAVAHGHVRLVGRQGRDEVAGGLGRVGVVAVDHEVVLGVDVAEHAPHHVALALAGLPAHHRPGRRGDVRGAVGGVVVVDVDRRLGQRRAEVGHHAGDGGRLVVARNEHGHPLAAPGRIHGGRRGENGIGNHRKATHKTTSFSASGRNPSSSLYSRIPITSGKAKKSIYTYRG